MAKKRILRHWIRRQLGWLNAPKILAYKGYANHNEIIVNGCIIKDKGIKEPDKSDSILRNAIAMIKRFVDDYIGNMQVVANYNGKQKHTVSDENGDFTFEFAIPKHYSFSSLWENVELNLSDMDAPPTIADVMMVNEDKCRFGVISDIDDTLLISHSTNLLKKLYNLLIKNANTRLTVDGIVEFYQALHQNHNNELNNPFFYISSSEWNLYDLLSDFCRIHGLPKGVFLLRRLKHSIWKFWKSGGGDHYHKSVKIEFLLAFYPNLKFILVGDSGQKDPEIYYEIAKQYPERILSIYIRNVSSAKRKQEIEKYITELSKRKVTMLLTDEIEDAYRHAVEHDFILYETDKMTYRTH